MSGSPTTAGTFSFRADYLGDSTYNAANSPCLPVTVEKYTPTLLADFEDGVDPRGWLTSGQGMPVSGPGYVWENPPSPAGDDVNYWDVTSDGDAQDAEDVLQETFIKAYRHLGSFEGRSNLTTWLYRIASNEAFMLLRRRKPDATAREREPPQT